MQIYSYSQIGTFHTNHNEDFFIKTTLTDYHILIVVLDGCSMGTESHFASVLIGKLLRKISKFIYYQSFIKSTFYNNKQLLINVLKQLFQQLSFIKNELNLETNELLSTLILGIINLNNQTAEIVTIGDGLIVCDGQSFEYEQDNQPDYLAYHLHENFENWFDNQKQLLSLQHIRDISFSTDGIFTFQPFNNKTYPTISEQTIIQQLLVSQQYSDYETMLKKQVITIEKEFGLKASDDLTIVRIIF
ncbi:MAG: protein phosphatase 2C domain-containing protein [Saprospiraceae bacterium]